MMHDIGVDIVENKRIKLNDQFLEHVLSSREKKWFSSLACAMQKRNFVAGRWAGKEAIIKAWKKPLVMSQIDLEYIDTDRKIITRIDGIVVETISVSISHENKFSVGFAIVDIFDNK